MTPENNEKRNQARKALFNEPKIEELTQEFNLTKDAKTAAIIIYRVIAGLGQGLTKSQKNSYSAMSISIAAKVVDDEKIKRKDIAEAADVSHRTLTRRFQELEEGKKSRKVLNYLKERIRTWSKKKEERLQEIL